MKNKNRITILERKVAQIQAEIDSINNEPCCPKCGSRFTKSTVYNRVFCSQEYGYCGVWVLHATPNRRASCEHSTYFRRTSYCNGILDDHLPMNPPHRILYFIANQEVSRDEYYI